MEAFLREAPPLLGHDAVSTPIRSHLAVTADEFTDNAAAMRALADEVRALHDQVLAGGGPQYVERHRARGKMMVRERLEALVDPGTPVLELCPLAGLHTGDPVGGGVVVALAEVAHTQCLVIANDPTVRGGTTSPTTIRKLLRAMDVAEENRLPVLILVESGGADLPRQADVFVPGGEQFRRLTQLSAQGIPTVCVVFGSSTAGGAYLPGMSDYTVMVEDRARVFLGGPPLVKMAIGEDADEEELGGAAMHARTSGLCDYLARDEPEALRMARGIVAHLHWTRLGPGPAGPADPPLVPGRGAARDRVGGRARALRRPRDPRPRRRRLALRGVQGALRRAARLRLGLARRLPDRGRGQQRHPLLARGAEGRAVHRAVQPHRHPDPVRAEHHRLHGGHALRAGRDHQGRGQADQRRLQLDRAPSDPHGRRQLRSRQLRHGGPGLRPPLHLHLAQPPHRRHGAQAAGGRPLHRAPQRGRGGGPPVRRGGRRGAAPGHRAARSRRSRPRSTPRGACGTTGSSTRATRAPCSPSPSPPCTRRRCAGRPSSAWCATDGGVRSAASSWPTGARSPAASSGRARRRVRGRRRLRGGRRRQPARRRGRRRRAAARGDAAPRRTSTPARWCGAARGGRCRRAAPGLRVPLREPRPPRGLCAGAASSGSARRPRRCGSWATRQRAKEVVADAGVPVLPSVVVAPGADDGAADGRRRGRRLPAPRQGVRRRWRPRACGWCASPASWPRPSRRPSARPRPPSARTRSSWSGTWPPPVTSRCRSSGTPTAPCCTSSTGSARCSAGTRRSSRRPRPSSCPTRDAPPDVGGRRGGGQGGRLRRRGHGGVPGRRRAASTSWR